VKLTRTLAFLEDQNLLADILGDGRTMVAKMKGAQVLSCLVDAIKLSPGYTRKKERKKAAG
jgi:hypothetical protein